MTSPLISNVSLALSSSQLKLFLLPPTCLWILGYNIALSALYLPPQLQGRNPSISFKSLSLTTCNQSIIMSYLFHKPLPHCSPFLSRCWHSQRWQHHLSLPGKLQQPSNWHPYLQSCTFPVHFPCSPRAIWQTKLKERNPYSSNPFKNSLLS